MSAQERPAPAPAAFEDDTRAGLSLVPVAEGVHLFITEPGPGGRTTGFCLVSARVPQAARELCEMAGVPVPAMPGSPGPGDRDWLEADGHARFAASLKRLRKARGWTQAELAVRAAVNRTTVSTAERGRRGLTLRHALALAGALGSDVTSMTREAEDGRG